VLPSTLSSSQIVSKLFVRTDQLFQIRGEQAGIAKHFVFFLNYFEAPIRTGQLFQFRGEQQVLPSTLSSSQMLSAI
jgi:hypothetical protein